MRKWYQDPTGGAWTTFTAEPFINNGSAQWAVVKITERSVPWLIMGSRSVFDRTIECVVDSYDRAIYLIEHMAITQPAERDVSRQRLEEEQQMPSLALGPEYGGFRAKT